MTKGGVLWHGRRARKRRPKTNRLQYFSRVRRDLNASPKKLGARIGLKDRHPMPSKTQA
jgi:hypothetical protein